jgi:hypothetical protein
MLTKHQTPPICYYIYLQNTHAWDSLLQRHTWYRINPVTASLRPHEQKKTANPMNYFLSISLLGFMIKGHEGCIIHPGTSVTLQGHTAYKEYLL